MTWWKVLRTQSRFEGDWYGALTNQISHTALGAFLATLFACVVREWTGNMPPRIMIVGAVVLPYLLIESVWQGWDRFDSVVDTMMTEKDL